MSHTDYKLMVSSARGGQNFYIAPNAGSGSGTLGNPYGLADLTTGISPVTPGTAFQALQPRDTLYFRGGDYHVAGDGISYYTPLLCPAVSGTFSEPITLRAYPGETVNIIMDSGRQPALGTYNPTLNYVRFLGFHIDVGTTASPAFYLGGTGNEVGYCEVIGHYAATGDNHAGIRMDQGVANRIHHCDLHGIDGLSNNSTQIQMYGDFQCIIEDNYVHDGRNGVFNKEVDQASGGDQNVFRRNYMTSCINQCFLGNNNSSDFTRPQLVYIYDNVVNGKIDLGQTGIGSQVYNNLIFVVPAFGYTVGIVASDHTWLSNFWNNITLSLGVAGLLGYYCPGDTFSTGQSTSPFTVCDYNVYDELPQWLFSGGYMTEADMVGNGLESHSQVAAIADIFVDQVGYALKPAFQAAGRFGDAVGPRPTSGVTVAQIMDTTRYGPAAIGGYS